jgi:hypothetical protein
MERKRPSRDGRCARDRQGMGIEWKENVHHVIDVFSLARDRQGIGIEWKENVRHVIDVFPPARD